ncbi:MAG: lipocalin-like domain-containing protein [Terracidiphilus sp.]|jgi:hypothetical protein
MKVLHSVVLGAMVTFAGLVQAQSASHPGGDRDKLIGAWHLVRIDATGTDGKSADVAQPKGILIYTRDGHISVQLMYPKPANVPSNEFVQDGYEASFGDFDIDEVKHLLTHHVRGSITRDLLVGKDVLLGYTITGDGHLIVRPARPDEHWSVTWEHY